MSFLKNALIFAAATALVLLSQDYANAGSFKYEGNKACVKCHEQIYSSWEKSLHANSFAILKPGMRKQSKDEAGLDPETDFRKDKSCMNCHVTGWEEGGYSFENQGGEWKGIGCETCHGAAEKWLPLHDKKDIKRRDRKLKQAGYKKPFEGKTVCARCHYHRNSPFNYRDLNRERDWTSPEFNITYHLMKKNRL